MMTLWSRREREAEAPAGNRRTRERRTSSGERPVLVMILVAIGVATIGLMSSIEVQNLGNSAAQSTSLQLGLREYEEALLARSAIDADILRAASSSNPGSAATDAAPRVADVGRHLALARTYFERANVPASLFADFDATADSLATYATTAATLADELVTNPAVAPGHLVQLQAIASLLDEHQTFLANQFQQVTTASQLTTQRSVRDARLRTIATTAAGVMTLILLTIGIDRRVRRNNTATRSAEIASADATGQLVEQVSRQRFSEELREALEGASDEDAMFGVVARAMDLVRSTGVSELLLADSSRAHLQRVAATSNAQGCDVASPWECPAVRRSATLVFESSDALRACPHLRDRKDSPISATCIPLLFNGGGIGVLHSVGLDGEATSTLEQAELRSIATETATRIGTIRVLNKSEFQARTDGLTGMLNRRSLEDHLRALVEAGRPFSIALADLDHFKNLNDTYGHEGGDRALRVFSSVAHETFRGSDQLGRYGGEEFVFTFPEQPKIEALAAIERFRGALAVTTASGACPPFTASFGVAEWHAGMGVDTILRSADLRLLQAKVRGRNCVVDTDEPELAEAPATDVPATR